MSAEDWLTRDVWGWVDRELAPWQRALIKTIEERWENGDPVQVVIRRADPDCPCCRDSPRRMGWRFCPDCGKEA